MAQIKRKTRKKISKQLNKLVKRHGAERALALVTGIVSSLVTDAAEKTAKKEKSAKGEKSAKKKKKAKEPAPAGKRESKHPAN
jgi:hypothetical protein